MKIKNLIPILALLVSACEASLDSVPRQPGNSNTGTGGSTARFAVVGNQLYTVDSERLQRFDVSAPSNPTLLGSSYVGMNIETIFPKGDYLFIGSQNGVFLYEVVDGEPRYLSQVQHFYGCDPVVANDTHAYVTVSTGSPCRQASINELLVVRLNQLTDMQQVSALPLQNPKGLGLAGDYLLVCDKGLKVFSLTNPDQPSLLETLPIEANDLIVANDLVMVIGDKGLYQYRFTDGQLDALGSLPIEAAAR